jgi:hypothetical protein
VGTADHAIVLVPPTSVDRRSVAAAGKHELLGGGVGAEAAGGAGVGAVGPGLGFSPLAQAPATTARIKID